MDLLSKDGIGTQVHYIPIYKFPLYRKYHGNKRLLKTPKYIIAVHYHCHCTQTSMSLKMPK